MKELYISFCKFNYSCRKIRIDSDDSEADSDISDDNGDNESVRITYTVVALYLQLV